jgi:cytochrome b involved in lipid metabolism
VYNINGFSHPGGRIIDTCRGRDCTALFKANHNSGALKKVKKYKVGNYGK